MKRILTIITSLLFITAGPSVWGQDIHFSQFYNSPLTLNPALTGYFDGSYRIAANYRRQWAGIQPNTPFTTIGASYDMHVPQHLLEDYLDKGTVSGGLQFFNDQSGIGQLTNQSIFLSGGYQRAIGEQERHKASGGIQVGYIRKSINYDKLVFRNQIRGAQIRENAPNGEKNLKDAVSYFDVRIGVLWSTIVNEHLSVTGGLSAYHLNFPNESFTQKSDNTLPPRFSLHGSARYTLTEKLNLHPSLLVMQQNTAQEINLGSSVSYPWKYKDELITLYGGMWFRMSAMNTIVDAVIPTIGAQYKNVRGGVSYDINISSLRIASGYRGGPEISIIYIPKIQRKLPVDKQLPCIRF